jgi:esterase/lipase superfamily enzyme
MSRGWILLTALLLAGCVGDKAEDVHSVWPGAGAADIERTVYYATDRASDESYRPGGFGKHWSDALSCGSTTAVIPQAGPPGEAAKGGKIKNGVVSAMACGGQLEDFARAVAAAARAQHCNEVLLYVHGFNTLFEDAALRSGQLANDTRSNCIALAFSWSSEGEVGRFIADIEHSAYAVPELEALLRALAAQGLRIDIVGHSMGARLALVVLASMAHRPNPPPNGFVSEIMLAAADIGADPVNDDFAHLVADARPFVHRITVYASRDDAVLAVSAIAHGDVPRAGHRPRGDAKLSGIDVVDASEAPAELLGHSYFGMSYEVLGDMTAVLQGVPIAQRTTLAQNGETPRRYVLIVAPERKPDLWTRIVRKFAPLLPRIELAPITSSDE